MTEDEDFALKLLLMYALHVRAGRLTKKKVKEIIKLLED